LAPTDPYRLRLSPTRDQLAGGEIFAIIWHCATLFDAPMPPGLLRAESGLREGPDFFEGVRHQASGTGCSPVF
jgi:hypothetical protein